MLAQGGTAHPGGMVLVAAWPRGRVAAWPCGRAVERATGAAIVSPPMPVTDPTDPDLAPSGDIPSSPRVALVLGSGGARGYAHIGVVQVLQGHGVDIVAVAGSSVGAGIGGMLAAGRLGEFTEWALGLGHIEALRLLDVSLTAKGAIRGEKMFKVVGDLVGDTLIEDLSIDYTAVAVDLAAQREVWFQSGPLSVAIRASSAMPMFLAPLELNGRMLVDGGILDPVPVSPVASTPADLVVAVDLGGRGPVADRPVSASASEGEEDPSEGLRRSAARWFDSDRMASVRRRMPADLEDSVRARLEREREAKPDTPGSLEVMQLSAEAMQAALTRHRLAAHPPDVVINVPRNAARTLELHRAEELIELGRQLALEALEPWLGRAAPGAVEEQAGSTEPQGET